MEREQVFEVAARLINESDGLLIGAGAGMGVDSGLPDFRGKKGFWHAYPALWRADISFQDAANPRIFKSNPQLAWGFYGHRLRLYRETIPHDNFRLLREIGARLEHGVCVFTSNVDGQFQKAGFDPDALCECHGSIHHLQCLESCTDDIWPADDVSPEVDMDHCLLTSPLPACRHCGGVARPNVLMFGDWNWAKDRTLSQQKNIKDWLARAKRPVVIEPGAGKDVATVRIFCEGLKRPLIRINPQSPKLGNARGISLAMGAQEAIKEIALRLNVQ